MWGGGEWKRLGDVGVGWAYRPLLSTQVVVNRVQNCCVCVTVPPPHTPVGFRSLHGLRCTDTSGPLHPLPKELLPEIESRGPPPPEDCSLAAQLVRLR